jgi:hypothetical protein
MIQDVYPESRIRIPRSKKHKIPDHGLDPDPQHLITSAMLLWFESLYLLFIDIS